MNFLPNLLYILLLLLLSLIVQIHANTDLIENCRSLSVYSKTDLMANDTYYKCWFMSNTFESDILMSEAKQSIQHLANNNIPDINLSNHNDVFIYIHAYQQRNSILGITVLSSIFEELMMSGLYFRARAVFVVLTGTYSYLMHIYNMHPYTHTYIYTYIYTLRPL